MSTRIIEEFCNSPAPAFRCYAAGDSSGGKFVAKLRHVLNGPASAASIAKLHRMLGQNAEPVGDFYKSHDGAVLYSDTLSDTAGIELLPIGKWKKASEDLREMFEELQDEPESDPDHVLSGVAIATVPGSGNYFVIPVEGPAAGQVFYADHDGWYESAFAADFEDFLVHIIREPAKLLAEELGCYTRYSDGKTKLQWIPEAYFSDISQIQSRG